LDKGAHFLLVAAAPWRYNQPSARRATVHTLTEEVRSMAAPTIDWYRTPIPKETLRQLTQRSDLRGWLQAGSFLLIYVVLTALAVYFFEARLWVLMVVACYLHSLFVNMVSMSAAVHELSHGTPFRTKPINEFFLYLFSFLTWNNPVHFRASHIQNHHPYTLHHGLDKEVVQGPVKAKLNGVNMLSWLVFDWVWFAKFMKVDVQHALGKGDADFFFWNPLLPRDDPRRKAMCRWARFMVVAYVVLLGAFIAFHIWVGIYLVFSYFFARILSNLTGAIQHTGLPSDVPDWRVICHTVKVNPIVSYLYWNMQYHTEHHMYAAVPFFNLPKLRDAILKDVPEAHKSFTGCLKTLYEIKRRQTTDPSYIYMHAFPAGAVPPRLK
jgi:fatty acid desaturase